MLFFLIYNIVFELIIPFLIWHIYEQAVFLFDLHLPPTYPNMPPEMYYYCTGEQLNPNLYKNGNVCCMFNSFLFYLIYMLRFFLFINLVFRSKFAWYLEWAWCGNMAASILKHFTSMQITNTMKQRINKVLKFYLF